MSTKRSERFSYVDKIDLFYSDFTNNFLSHPITKDLVIRTNENAIKQSLKNLIYTNRNERLFQPNIGCDIKKALFELNETFLAEDIKYYITKTIEENEPRVRLIDVFINNNQEKKEVTITLQYYIINLAEPQMLEIVFKRIR